MRSENCAIVNVTISFNVRDESEKQLLDYADNRIVNFSGTVKRILQEMRRADLTTPEEVFAAIRTDFAQVLPFHSLRPDTAGPDIDNDKEFDPLKAFL